MTQRNTWPRDRYTGPGGGLSTLPGGGRSTLPGGGLSTLPGGGLSTLLGGGLSTLPGGGLSTLPGGGLSTLPGGGLFTGACENPYRSNIPPLDVFIPLLRQKGFRQAADTLAAAHRLEL